MHTMQLSCDIIFQYTYSEILYHLSIKSVRSLSPTRITFANRFRIICADKDIARHYTIATNCIVACETSAVKAWVYKRKLILDDNLPAEHQSINNLLQHDTPPHKQNCKINCVWKARFDCLLKGIVFRGWKERIFQFASAYLSTRFQSPGWQRNLALTRESLPFSVQATGCHDRYGAIMIYKRLPCRYWIFL